MANIPVPTQNVVSVYLPASLDTSSEFTMGSGTTAAASLDTATVRGSMYATIPSPDDADWTTSRILPRDDASTALSTSVSPPDAVCVPEPGEGTDESGETSEPCTEGIA